MAITYPLTLPASPGFVTSRFRLVSNVTVHASPLSKVEQVLERDGALWGADYGLPPMKRAQAAAWIAALVALRGRFGTFYAFDPDARTPRGVATGTPLVDGASQAGNTLNTKGWSVSVTGIVKAGDYLEVNTRLHMVVQDANSAAGGLAALAIEPKLRESPADNAAITMTNAKVRMRLAANEVAWDADNVARFGLSFAAVEAL